MGEIRIFFDWSQIHFQLQTLNTWPSWSPVSKSSNMKENILTFSLDLDLLIKSQTFINIPFVLYKSF